MPANVEQMFSVKETPWHELGHVIPEAPSIDEAIKLAGLDWEVGTKQLYTEDGRKVPAKYTYRMTDNKILGVVGPRYIPYQNTDAFDWFNPFIESGECELHTAGSLDHGKKVWVLAKLNRDNSVITKSDEVAKFILLSNSHDGSTAIRVGYTPIRVVCANTLAMAHNSKVSKLLRVRHTASSTVNLEKVREIMDNVNLAFEATAEQYRHLANKAISANDLRKYVKIILGVENKPEVDIPTRTKNTMEEIIQRCTRGIGNDNPGVAGTWYGAYLGVNEWLNYGKGRTNDTRMNSLWFGPNMATNNKALETALSLAV